MKVTIQNFRRYTYQELEIPDGQLVLFKGESGAGKSTIFEAIFWALYKTVREVEPTTSLQLRKTPTTRVVLEMDGHTIQRTANPKSLKVTLDTGKQIENTTAQDYLIRKYSTPETWLATSYIRQGQHHPFLAYEASKRMKILNQIVLQEEDPSVPITKIQTAIREVEFQLKDRRRQCDMAQAAYKKVKSNKDISEQHRIQESDLPKYEKAVRVGKETISKLRLRRDAVYQTRIKRQHILASLEDYRHKLQQVPCVSQEDIKLLVKKKKLYTSSLKRREQIASKNKTLRSLERQIAQLQGATEGEPPLFSKEDVSKAIADYRLHSEMKMQAANLGVEYKREVIMDRIEDMEENLDVQWVVKIKDAYSQKKREIKELVAHIKERDEPDTENLRLKIAEMERSKHVLACPSCNAGLMYNQGRLVLAQDAASYDPVLHQELKRKYQESLDTEKRLAKIKWLKEELDSIEIPTVITKHPMKRIKDVEGCRKKLGLLKKIVFVEPPSHLPEYMQLCVRWHEIKQEINGLEQETHETAEKVTQEDVTRAMEQKTQREYMQKQIAKMERELEATPEEKVSLEELDAEIETKTKRVENVELKLRRHSITKVAMGQFEELTRLENEVETLHEKMVDLHKIKDTAMEVQRETLRMAVENINACLAELAQEFFCIPVIVTLGLSKKVKATGLDKTVLDIKVHFAQDTKAGRNPSQGERNRISLLVTTAMAKISGSRLLILDEALNSLDMENRDKVLRTIRQVLPDVTLIITSHDAAEGDYESIFKVEKLD